MQVNLLFNCDSSQVNGFKRFQQGFRPRRCRGPFGVACIQPGQFLMAFGQSTLNDVIFRPIISQVFSSKVAENRW